MSLFLRNDDEVAVAVEQHTRRSYVVGLDVGQAQDPSAIAVIQKVERPHLEKGRIPERPRYATTYRVRHLERLPLGMSYPAQAAHVGRLMGTAPLRGNARLVIDRTGCGRPVFDMFAEAGLNPVGVTITAGDGWSAEGGTQYRVSKRLLVSNAEAAIHSGALQIDGNLPEAKALIQELQDFQVSYTATGAPTYGARVGRHDDIVLACCIGLWWSGLVRHMTVGEMRW